MKARNPAGLRHDEQTIDDSQLVRTEALVAALGTAAWWVPLTAGMTFVVGMITYPRVRRYARGAAAIGFAVIAVLFVWIASSSVHLRRATCSAFSKPFSP